MYRIDGSTEFNFDLDEAIAAFEAHGERMVSWRLSDCERQYEVMAILDRRRPDLRA